MQYVNPGNSGFQVIVNSDYVDKTGLIEQINSRIDTTERLVCVSRPRRFGKSFAAQMLAAYYDSSCDSHALFDNRKISKSADYEKHLNSYNVICFDVTSFISMAVRENRPLSEVPNLIVNSIQAEVVKLYPQTADEKTLTDCLLRVAEGFDGIPGKKFVFVIDEWDAIMREAKSDEATQNIFLDLLREWFKNISFTPKVVAAAYMTGILPIKKNKSQSAISDFTEYTILYPNGFAEYTGFTESDVKDLCIKYKAPFEELKQWYDGYDFSDCEPIYNPYSVMRAIRDKKCRSYWMRTSAAAPLFRYINLDYDGLQEIIAGLISGASQEVDIDGFENDFEKFKSKDDVLTLLVHLGYLFYDEESRSVRIPNEEVRLEFNKVLKLTDANDKWISLIHKSEDLLENTLKGKSESVAEAISEIRDSQYAPTYYNDEQALRYVIKFAYIAAIDKYLTVEELPSGHGVADVVYIPKPKSSLPAMIIELKWNKSSDGAIRQIKDRNYPAILEGYIDETVLVGINYDEKTKKHTCQIEVLGREDE